ncbi:hypothetical protein NP233_g11459 [Leucocoprinus birnbaumii]|uniref:Uncharacterized protein n=1 Tax=Leucocoprinus birnbaumii TaxID=56174 RepID=A0AAD5VHD8_9AGAR|nr:hypothetical protein NP233_g11459 [Leucocoprinus birnbaumii]
MSFEIPCAITSSATLNKAIFSVLFIAWQTVANICASEIVNHAFSSEWYIQFRQHGKLIPGRTDCVSTITSGFQDRLLHFIGPSASLSYCLAYLTFWVLFALAGIAPSSINVDLTPRSQEALIAITNFTFTGGDMDTTLSDPIIRTGSIVDLENRQKTPYGFSNQEGIIVGWPFMDSMDLMGDMIYESDALLYNHTCWWEAPSVNMSQWNTTCTVSETSLKKRTFNLDNLPTTFNSSGFHFIDFDSSVGLFETPLATFLLCDPHARILDGRVLVDHKNMSLTLQSTLAFKNKPKVGNINPDAANVVLGLSLMDALENDDETARIRVGTLASQVFLNDTSLDFSRSEAKPFDVGILPMQDIQRNLNRFMQSGSKVLSSYVHNQDNSKPSTLIHAEGAMQTNQEMLTGSRGFLIITICLFFAATLAMVFSLFFLHIWESPALKLETMIRVFEELGGIEKGMKGFSFPSPTPGSDRPCTQDLLIRLSGFILLEAAFFSLVLVFSKNPILVNIPLSSAEVRGGFNLLFILWQGLAIFLLSHAVSFAFSSEWSLQHQRNNQLIPGQTDRVSRLTSGNDDRLRYLVTRKSSATFKFAFLLSNVLFILNSSAPGTLSISQVMVPNSTSLSIGDLSLVTSSQDDSNDSSFTFPIYRADTLTFLEHHEGFKGFTFRYEMEPHWIMAWPDELSIESSITGAVEYPTDVVKFDYSCIWQTPPEMEVDDDGATTWLIDGYFWSLWSDPLPQFVYLGGIVPLYRYLDVQPDANFAVLVIGTNSSLPVDPDPNKRSIINLDHLPTSFHPEGLLLNNTDAITSHWISPLSVILYCDPSIEASGGRARLSPTKALEVTASGLPAVGNIPHNATTTIFTSALLDVLDTGDETVGQWLGTQSVDMFLANPIMNFTAFPPSGAPLVDLVKLNENFNAFTLSASKAFLDGVTPDPQNQSLLLAHTRSVVGSGEIEQQALTGDKTLGIVERGDAFELSNIASALYHEIVPDIKP